MTECKTERVQFHALGSREVCGQFDGGDISSDAGGLLLREVEKRTGILKQFAGCFQDYRDPRFVEHRIEPLVGKCANLSWKLKRLQTLWFDGIGRNNIKPVRERSRDEESVTFGEKTQEEASTG